MVFYHKGLRVCKIPLPFVAYARKTAILREQIWSAYESDVEYRKDKTTFQPEKGHPRHAATRTAQRPYFPCVLSPHGGIFLSGEQQYFTPSGFREIGLQDSRKVFLRQRYTPWRRLICVVDIAQDVSIHGDAARSGSRPAGGGRYARAALRGRLSFCQAPSQLSNLLREVEPETALLVFQCSNRPVEFVVLSHIVGRHR
jgi:hypothetical protein